jgi:hypothetical protein
MGVIIQDEDEFSYQTEFTPFQDSNKARINAAVNLSANTNPGMDTREIDSYRQGIEISSNTYRFAGSTAKIWSGNIKGCTKIQTLGQSVSFTEYEGTKIFEETQVYQPVNYINSTEEVYFASTVDDIPVDNVEAVIAPFTIKNRFGLNKGYDPQGMQGIHGVLEDGNESYYTVNPSSCIIEQFITFNDTKDNSHFNDCDNPSPKDSTENKLDRFETGTTIIPYNDTGSNTIIRKINTTDVNFIKLIFGTTVDINLDEDIRETYGRASAAAGHTVYGPNGSECGTDSIAYIGLIKGN